MKNLTLVTEIYNCKSPNYYFSYHDSSYVLSLDCNLVIFTESNLFWDVYNLRKKYNLNHKTIFIIEEFKDLKYQKHLNDIENYHLNTKPIQPTSINILSYNKFACIQTIVEKNPFNTTHIGWIDIGLGYYSEKNYARSLLEYLPDAVHVHLYKYLELPIVNNKDFYGNNIHHISGNFWIGPIEKTRIFAQKCEEELLKAFKNEYAPFETQIMTKIICQNKDLFTYSYGPINHILINWEFPNLSIDAILEQMVFPALIHNLDPYIAINACDAILEAWLSGMLHLKVHQIFHLFDEMIPLLIKSNNIEKAKKNGMHLYNLLISNPTIFVGSFPIWRNKRMQTRFNRCNITLPFAYNTADYGLAILTKHISENKDITGFSDILKDNFHHFVALQKIAPIITGCGSYMINGVSSLDYCIEMLPKQQNLFAYSKGKKSILEIGLYAGHSALIILLANKDNPNFKMVSIDRCDNYFTEPCALYLQKEFPGKLQFVKGSSLDALPSLLKEPNLFDLFHVDGEHGDVISVEMQLIKDFCLSFQKGETVIIFDDYETDGTKNALRKFPELKILEIPKCIHSNVVCSLNL